MAEPGKGKRRIIVREQKEIHKGTRHGRDYVIYQVIATTEGGVPIEENLRSFQQLPKNQLIEVEIEKFDSPQWGVSYTLSTKKSGGEAVGKRIGEMERQLAELTKRVVALEGGRTQTAPAAPAGPPAQRSPGMPEVRPQQPPQLPGEGQAPTDDIPF